MFKRLSQDLNLVGMALELVKELCKVLSGLGSRERKKLESPSLSV